MLRSTRSMASRREPEDIDACVLSALATRMRSGVEFTHDQLVEDTGLNACAIKYALERLEGRGVVQALRRIQVRSQRFRTIWRLVEGSVGTAPSSPAASPNAARTTHSTR